MSAPLSFAAEAVEGFEVIPGDHHTRVTRHVAAFASRLEARLQRVK